MSTATFDTLKLSRRLEAAGFSREQSAGMTEALSDALGDTVVTRDYLDTRLAGTEAKLDTRLAGTEAKIARVESELKADLDARFARSDAKFAEVKFDILKWLFAALVGQTAVLAALVKLL